MRIIRQKSYHEYQRRFSLANDSVAYREKVVEERRRYNPLIADDNNNVNEEHPGIRSEGGVYLLSLVLVKEFLYGKEAKKGRGKE